MVSQPPPNVERVLVVVAHPDDVDFGCAGAVARWTSEGVAVSYCLCTDGDAGGFDETVTREQMARIRREEQTNAASEVGVTDIHFLAFPDGRLEVTLDLRRAIARVIRQVRPQRILIPSPERNYDRVYASHPDHLAAGEAALCAVYPDARNPFAHPELLEKENLEPWSVPQTWIVGHPKANVWVDITDTFDRKIAALRRHVSQVGMRDPEQLGAMIRSWATAIAEQGGLPEGRLAEGYRTMETG